MKKFTVLALGMFVCSSSLADLLVGTRVENMCSGDGFMVRCDNSRVQCLSDGSCTVWINGILVKGTVTKGLRSSK
jgi:hypothetical protein